jgi:ADP-ribose pyrophosphatase
MKWKTLGSKYISRHQYFTARVDQCEMPDGKMVEEYFVVELPESACALALTDDNEAVMVKQYRYPVDDTMLELPGGFIDEKEDPLTGMARELKEETGYEFNNVEYLGKVAANPGVLNNYTHLFLATGGKKVTGQSLDHNEEIEVMLFPVDEIRRMLQHNEIKQALHVCCMLYAFQKLDEKS